MPIRNRRKPIQDLVIIDLVKRKKLGIKRYGTLLQAFNGRNALMDAYQEILDLSIYIRQELEERKHACPWCLRSCRHSKRRKK